VITRDSYGNPRNGVQINWSLGTGGGSLNTTQNLTGNDGTASVTRTLGPGTGSQTVNAAANPALSPASVTFTTTAALTVSVANNVFNPQNVTVAQNGTVTWQWVGLTALHNVTFAAVTGAPGNIADRSSGSESRTFTATGTFTYQCTNHIGMTGQVVVTP
jgi:plastocyanin